MLIPADRKRCQADIPTGHSFMTLGPRTKYRRCNNLPTIILHEKIEADDGQKGAMSLCPSCLSVASDQLNMSDYKIEALADG